MLRKYVELIKCCIMIYFCTSVLNLNTESLYYSSNLKTADRQTDRQREVASLRIIHVFGKISQCYFTN